MTELAVDRRQGGDAAVVMLHGIGGGKAIWADALPAVAAAGYDAIALDLPGYAESAARPPGGMERMAKAVLETMDSLDLPQAVLLGHSMGGMVAQEIAATAPWRVQGLILACTSPAFGKADGDWQARFVAERLAPLDEGLGMLGLAKRLVPGMVSPKAVADAQAKAMAVMAAVPEATYRHVLAAIVGFERRAALASIRVPTLCLAGAQDRTAPPEVLRRMAAHIAGAEYAELADAGHIANVEQPAAFAAAVLGFLQRHFPPDDVAAEPAPRATRPTCKE